MADSTRCWGVMLKWTGVGVGFGDDGRVIVKIWFVQEAFEFTLAFAHDIVGGDDGIELVGKA